jgi:hypothetical protein
MTTEPRVRPNGRGFEVVLPGWRYAMNKDGFGQWIATSATPSGYTESFSWATACEICSTLKAMPGYGIGRFTNTEVTNTAEGDLDEEPGVTNRRLEDYFTPTGGQVRQAAVRRGPRENTRILMREVTSILETFAGSMSTRQVYYQLVSRGALENNDRAYERAQRLLVQMRRDGAIPYRRIVDRNRAKHARPGWDGAEDIMEDVAIQFRRDAWAEQDTIVMVALEKAALEGVFAEVVDEYGAQLWTTRGYTSESFAYEWATEIKRFADQGKTVVVRYFGDFDPSGIGLEKDAWKKVLQHEDRFVWERRGLLLSDLDSLDAKALVPVKDTDSRSKRYRPAFGDVGAELDALDPGELARRIRESILEHIDPDAWARTERAEAVERESLAMVRNNWEAAVRGAREAGHAA